MKSTTWLALQTVVTCALCGFLFWSGHTTAGAWALVVVALGIHTRSSDK